MNKVTLFLSVVRMFLVLSGVLFAVILFFSNPDSSNINKGLFLLFSSIFVWSAVSLVVFYLKKKLTNNELLYVNVKSSVRQGLFAGLLLLGVLSLAAIRLLTWWDFLLLAFSLILLELYFKSERIIG